MVLDRALDISFRAPMVLDRALAICRAVASVSDPTEWLTLKVAISMTTKLMAVASLSQEWLTLKAAISITTTLMGMILGES